MKKLLSTKDVAEFLNVNEKMVYTLVADKGLPASKITGKWLFPRHLVEQWIETQTINYPDTGHLQRVIRLNHRQDGIISRCNLLHRLAGRLEARSRLGHARHEPGVERRRRSVGRVRVVGVDEQQEVLIRVVPHPPDRLRPDTLEPAPPAVVVGFEALADLEHLPHVAAVVEPGRGEVVWFYPGR